MATAPKLQRWTDLLAALLRRHFPVPFEELAKDVPAYLDKKQKPDARARMFERDKDELRAFGIPIESALLGDGETHGYKLGSPDFYLPYLALVEDGKPQTKPSKVDQYGYRALASLAFEPDELAAVSDAATRVRSLGDPHLASDAESAMRKLAFDLPVATGASDGTHVTTRDVVDAEVFESLGDALVRRKRVTFDYHAMDRDETNARTVEPYGLFFLDSHWYLACRDTDRDALRNFRVSRVSRAIVNSRKANSADYVIPASFDLREHARSRQAWELGDAEAVDVVVEFTGGADATVTARKLGEPVKGKKNQRRFMVRRTDAFCRWILSFSGDAVPLSPPAVAGEFQRMIKLTTAVYEEWFE